MDASFQSTDKVEMCDRIIDLRRGNLVGIRSKINVQGVGYLYSFTHRENWDLGP